MDKLHKSVAIHIVIIFLISSLLSGLDLPSFKSPIENVTVTVGREAVLACAVENLNPYKVAWLKVDTQTILTIHNHVITKNNRIGIFHTENDVWRLHIKDVRESDHGWYMCQINTDPMKSQRGYLSVVVPPDILDYPTSTDMVVDEGANVTLQCIARGLPDPKVIWKREDGEKIDLQNNSQVFNVSGSVLTITNVKRHHMGAYLCIASNGVPPTISKRIKLIVQWGSKTSNSKFESIYVPGDARHVFLARILEYRQKAYFQQDGCPAHSTILVGNWFNRKFREKWIGRYGPICWPARSPDLSPLDYFLWGFSKERVYREPVQHNVDFLKSRIIEAAAQVNEEMINSTYAAFRKILERFVELGGLHVE